MKNHGRRKLKRQGTALVLAILAMTLLMVTGGAMLALGLQSRTYQIRTSSDMAARCAADAGLEKALYEINYRLQTGQFDNQNLPCETSVALEGSDSSYSYQITRQTNGTYLAQATGTSNGNQRTVEAVLSVKNPFDFAVFTEDTINMYNSSWIDWYNYTAEDAPMKVGTNSTNATAVELKNDIIINGDVVVGAGGNPDEVIVTKQTTQIYGNTYAQTYSQTLPSVTVPSGLQSLSSSGSITGDTILTGSGKYDQIYLGNSNTVTAEGPVEIYITGNLYLGNSSVIEVDNSNPNSSLTIYLAGNISSENSSIINNSTQVPYKLKIYGLDTCTQLDFKNGAQMYGVVYAPKADVVFHNSAQIYGSLIGKSLDIKNSANLSYDASLREPQDAGSLVSIEVSRWTE